jgi:hypothetical protein
MSWNNVIPADMLRKCHCGSGKAWIWCDCVPELEEKKEKQEDNERTENTSGGNQGS